ncbi:hypothetical protein F5J12DRAFT_849814 [Pisolithus orientalis]|uniref:uncharacterized protein n=1 Tax=Pisolithus orientalis TaxID=936130 RepID=UPI0022244173|nr:uncharacterized protein F5J12DRAFT_849814 [Pisolithus orientalis]KAI5998345.1 hypothetical protein F5J12DRAFT_849814 [Pisolithus orientalis]
MRIVHNSLMSPSPTRRLLDSVVYKAYLRDSEWRQKAKHADHDTCSTAEDMAPMLLKSDVNMPGIRMVGVLGLEWVDGKSVRVLLPGGSEVMVSQDSDATDGIGPDRAKMHIVNIIHGDLTTLNMILCRGDKDLVLIDFGLAYHSSLVEDKAVDLYVLEHAFASTHPDAEPLFNSVLASYEKHLGKHWSVIKKQLDDVRLRGRKCSTVG